MWLPPALSAAKLKPPDTSTGVSRSVVVPSPTWPSMLGPQQWASPAMVSPQLNDPPGLSEVKLRPPETRTGVSRLVVVPSPSWPSGFSPQQ